MLDEKTLDNLAVISRLQLSDKERSDFRKELSALLEYFSQIQAVQEEKAKELFHVRESKMKRDDAVKPSKNSSKIRSQFNNTDEEGFLVAPRSL